MYVLLFTSGNSVPGLLVHCQYVCAFILWRCSLYIQWLSQPCWAPSLSTRKTECKSGLQAELGGRVVSRLSWLGEWSAGWGGWESGQQGEVGGRVSSFISFLNLFFLMLTLIVKRVTVPKSFNLTYLPSTLIIFRFVLVLQAIILPHKPKSIFSKSSYQSYTYVSVS